MIGMPRRFACMEGDQKLVREEGAGQFVWLEYAACECVNLDFEEGVWILQAAFLDNCA